MLLQTIPLTVTTSTYFTFQSGGGEPRDVTSDQVELLLSDPRENWDVVKDDPDFLLVGEKKVRLIRSNV